MAVFASVTQDEFNFSFTGVSERSEENHQSPSERISSSFTESSNGDRT